MNYLCNPELGFWTRNQRQQYQMMVKGKPSRMTTEKAKALTSIERIVALPLLAELSLSVWIRNVALRLVPRRDYCWKVKSFALDDTNAPVAHSTFQRHVTAPDAVMKCFVRCSACALSVAKQPSLYLLSNHSWIQSLCDSLLVVAEATQCRRKAAVAYRLEPVAKQTAPPSI
eukprot:15351040-Ditylum_brightwellii.AAC.2